MTAKGRIHAIRLSEKIRKNPQFARKAGIKSEMINKWLQKADSFRCT